MAVCNPFTEIRNPLRGFATYSFKQKSFYLVFEIFFIFKFLIYSVLFFLFGKMAERLKATHC